MSVFHFINIIKGKIVKNSLKTFLFLFMVCLVFSAPSVNIFAQSSSSSSNNSSQTTSSTVPEACKAASKINVADLFQPAKFLPLIPKECALNGDSARSLPVSAFPYILIRLYQLLSSFAFFLFAMGIIIFGIQYILIGVTNNGDPYNLYKQLRLSLFGLLMVGLSYLIVSTVTYVLRIDSTDFLKTDTSTFFQ